MASGDFERFRFSFFEDAYFWRDGLDTDALATLTGDERARAEHMLIDYLPDTRGVVGLGVLRSRRAEPKLVQMFEAELQGRKVSDLAAKGLLSPYVVVALAKALWLIRPDPRWSAALIDALAFNREPLQRMDAAIALHEVRSPAAVHALIQALDDDKSLVRHHAARGLLAFHGLPSESNETEHMMCRVMSDDPARREGGKRDILAAIAGRPLVADSPST
jgi:HEAT repeat protein